MLDEIRDCYGTRRLITVGASFDSDIRIIEKLANDEDPSVSRDHCQICRTPEGRVFVRRAARARNSTKVNRVRVRKGMVEMAPGDKLILGRVELLAIAADGLPRLRITADDPADYIDRMVKSTGNTREAASVFGVDHSTVVRRRNRGRS